MTQPGHVNQTFDTSLVDIHQQAVNRSFSSTETNSSGGSNTADLKKAESSDQPGSTINRASAAGPQAEPFTAVTNAQLYDTWAQTYDSDGNVLQAVDDLELERLLPEFVSLVCQAAVANKSFNRGEQRMMQVLDFGCGTGRNTVKLLQAGWSDATAGESAESLGVEIHGWDASEAMLSIARRKCSSATPSAPNVHLTPTGLQCMDFAVSPLTALDTSFTGIISTLVLEHLPLRLFFEHIVNLLAAGGYALVTNMHPDMGCSTRAGYKTASGERVKGDSWVHGVEESVRAAQEAGLEVVAVREKSVDEGMIQKGAVGQRGRKWVGIRVWYGFVVKKRGS